MSECTRPKVPAGPDAGRTWTFTLNSLERRAYIGRFERAFLLYSVEFRMVASSQLRAALSKLRSTGFFVVEELTQEEYIDFGHRLGHPFCTTHVAIDAKFPFHLAQPGPVPLHTDSYVADIVSWYCYQQDPKDGATLLLDCDHVLATLDKDHLEVLQTIHISHPQFTRLPSVAFPPTFTLLTVCEESRSIYYAPWLTLQDYSRGQLCALERFKRAICHAATDGLIRVRLRPGEAVFVDNHRMLHGRDGVQEGGGRSLLRVWLRSEVLK